MSSRRLRCLPSPYRRRMLWPRSLPWLRSVRPGVCPFRGSQVRASPGTSSSSRTCPGSIHHRPGVPVIAGHLPHARGWWCVTCHPPLDTAVGLPGIPYARPPPTVLRDEAAVVPGRCGTRPARHRGSCRLYRAWRFACPLCSCVVGGRPALTGRGCLAVPVPGDVWLPASPGTAYYPEGS